MLGEKLDDQLSNQALLPPDPHIPASALGQIAAITGNLLDLDAWRVRALRDVQGLGEGRGEGEKGGDDKRETEALRNVAGAGVGVETEVEKGEQLLVMRVLCCARDMFARTTLRTTADLPQEMHPHMLTLCTPPKAPVKGSNTSSNKSWAWKCAGAAMGKGEWLMGTYQSKIPAGFLVAIKNTFVCDFVVFFNNGIFHEQVDVFHIKE